MTTTYTKLDVFNYALNNDINNLQLALNYGDNGTKWYKDAVGITALHVAAARNHFKCIELLLDMAPGNIDIGESIYRESGPATHHAADNGHVESLQFLLEKGANINGENDSGGTVLHRAAQEGHVQCVEVLLQKGVIINESVDEYGPNEHFITDVRPMIIAARKKIVSFIASIDHYIGAPNNKTCLSICYPNIDARNFAKGHGNLFGPSVGWTRAESILKKYYFDEIFFNLHFHIGNIYRLKKLTDATGVEGRFSEIVELSSKCNDTSTLMTVLTDRLKDFLDPSVILCSSPKCYLKGKSRCSRCQSVCYCSTGCQQSDWKYHKLNCQSI